MEHENVRIIAIIQARMGSTRLPGKVLEDIAGQPMLVRVVNRTRQAKTPDVVVTATTIQPTDAPIVRLCETQDWPYFRGSEEDVLDRYYQAALVFKADVIVRITADCPLIDPEIIDRAVKIFLFYHPEVEYVSNTLIRTFPQGLDVEVMSFAALKKAWQEDRNSAWREHVTPYIYEHPEMFRLFNVKNDEDLSYMRWTVDTQEDLDFVRAVYTRFDNKDTFNWCEVLALLAQEPSLADINRHVRQKTLEEC